MEEKDNRSMNPSRADLDPHALLGFCDPQSSAFKGRHSYPDAKTLVHFIDKCPSSLKAVDQYGNTFLHLLCLHPAVTSALLEEVFTLPSGEDRAWVKKLLSTPNRSGNLPLHFIASCPAVNASLIGVLGSRFREGAATKHNAGALPLLLLSRNRKIDSAALEALIALHPPAVKEKNGQGFYPLHVLCSNSAVTAPLLATLLDWHPDAATDKYNSESGSPFHILLRNPSLKSDPRMIHEFLLGWWPKAIEANDNRRDLPLHALLGGGALCLETLECFLDLAGSTAAAAPNGFGELPLHVFAGSTSATGPMATKLIQAYPASAMTLNPDGYSPLALVCRGRAVVGLEGPELLAALFRSMFGSKEPLVRPGLPSPLTELCSNRHFRDISSLITYLRFRSEDLLIRDEMSGETPAHALMRNINISVDRCLAAVVLWCPEVLFMRGRGNETLLEALTSARGAESANQVVAEAAKILAVEHTEIGPQHADGSDAAKRLHAGGPTAQTQGLATALVQAAAGAGLLLACQDILRGGPFSDIRPDEQGPLTDLEPRTIREIGALSSDSQAREYFERLGSFLGRWRILSLVHAGPSTLILRATDLNHRLHLLSTSHRETFESTDGAKKYAAPKASTSTEADGAVVLKLSANNNACTKEIIARKAAGRLDPKVIVPLLTTSCDEGFSTHPLNKSLVEDAIQTLAQLHGARNGQFRWALVHPYAGLGARTLEMIVRFETLHGASRGGRHCTVPAPVRLFAQFLDALASLHSKSIVHGNLVPSNVLRFEEPSGQPVEKDPWASLDHKRLKLIDLGSALSVLEDDEDDDDDDDDDVDGLHGIQVEIASDVTASPSISDDIWSAGCILFFIMTGNTWPGGKSAPKSLDVTSASKKLHFSNIHDRLDQVNGQLAVCPAARDLLCQLLALEPQARESLALRTLLKTHPFFYPGVVGSDSRGDGDLLFDLDEPRLAKVANWWGRIRNEEIARLSSDPAAEDMHETVSSHSGSAVAAAADEVTAEETAEVAAEEISTEAHCTPTPSLCRGALSDVQLQCSPGPATTRRSIALRLRPPSKWPVSIVVSMRRDSHDEKGESTFDEEDEWWVAVRGLVQAAQDCSPGTLDATLETAIAVALTAQSPELGVNRNHLFLHLVDEVSGEWKNDGLDATQGAENSYPVDLDVYSVESGTSMTELLRTFLPFITFGLRAVYLSAGPEAVSKLVFRRGSQWSDALKARFWREECKELFTAPNAGAFRFDYAEEQLGHFFASCVGARGFGGLRRVAWKECTNDHSITPSTGERYGCIAPGDKRKRRERQIFAVGDRVMGFFAPEGVWYLAYVEAVHAPSPENDGSGNPVRRRYDIRYEGFDEGDEGACEWEKVDREVAPLDEFDIVEEDQPTATGATIPPQKSETKVFSPPPEPGNEPGILTKHTSLCILWTRHAHQPSTMAVEALCRAGEERLVLFSQIDYAQDATERAAAAAAVAACAAAARASSPQHSPPPESPELYSPSVASGLQTLLERLGLSPAHRRVLVEDLGLESAADLLDEDLVDDEILSEAGLSDREIYEVFVARRRLVHEAKSLPEAGSLEEELDVVAKKITLTHPISCDENNNNDGDQPHHQEIEKQPSQSEEQGLSSSPHLSRFLPEAQDFSEALKKELAQAAGVGAMGVLVQRVAQLERSNAELKDLVTAKLGLFNRGQND